ncbi:hypothetical protein [Paenibacillus jilunlii]|uniref:Uncharacterized protein n=1 Tax=Paenibacillus jilunlii TaxID=682956 RepID=A0A1G9ZYS0_9BACL|nr:hypothetical protein [Paenibacillus jilunlii]KWX79928.1 hypothetical protein AML91_01805 [Paenibacillus jilunlii]SDN26752.1 hypothetical protein SAMN05216191_13415 [Paenibacillus jilunlii]
MKLHTDGTVEGTPEEIMKYQQLKPIGVKPLGPATSIGKPVGDSMRYLADGTTYVSGQQSQANYDVNAKTTTV